jgi:hypothetical protein
MEHNMILSDTQKSLCRAFAEGFRDGIVDTVFYTADCDAEYVRKSLINHDGFSPNIVVVKDSK